MQTFLHFFFVVHFFIILIASFVPCIHGLANYHGVDSKFKVSQLSSSCYDPHSLFISTLSVFRLKLSPRSISYKLMSFNLYKTWSVINVYTALCNGAKFLMHAIAKPLSSQLKKSIPLSFCKKLIKLPSISKEFVKMNIQILTYVLKWFRNSRTW